MVDFQPTILIVDDMQMNLTILSRILKDEYIIKVAKSGEKAIIYQVVVSSKNKKNST